jgi:uncharacterized protein (DUF2249 family)/quercetin dioxygenase-like cupin family protein
MNGCEERTFMNDDVVDVRAVRKPDKHPTIFAAYNALECGESFVLVNNHDPLHLHEEFEDEYAGSYEWDYLESGPRVWRIEIRKLTSTPLPRLLCNSALVTAADSDATGAAWKLQTRERDLDSNIIRLPPTGTIGRHTGPDVDVLVHVLSGTGELTTENGALALTPGALVWLPRRSSRQFTAGSDGISYLTVHQRRQALTLSTRSS